MRWLCKRCLEKHHTEDLDRSELYDKCPTCESEKLVKVP